MSNKVLLIHDGASSWHGIKRIVDARGSRVDLDLERTHVDVDLLGGRDLMNRLYLVEHACMRMGLDVPERSKDGLVVVVEKAAKKFLVFVGVDAGRKHGGRIVWRAVDGGLVKVVDVLADERGVLAEPFVCILNKKRLHATVERVHEVAPGLGGGVDGRQVDAEGHLNLGRVEEIDGTRALARLGVVKVHGVDSHGHAQLGRDEAKGPSAMLGSVAGVEFEESLVFQFLGTAKLECLHVKVSVVSCHGERQLRRVGVKLQMTWCVAVL